MDLALELGFRTVADLRREMTESELGQWYRYAVKRWLPGRRMELMLANIARMTAGSDSILPFIFDPVLRLALEPKQVGGGEQAAAALSAVAGGIGVYKLGVRKIADIRREAANG